MPRDSGAHPLRAFEQLMLSECMKSSISFLSRSSPQEPIPPTDAVWLGTNSDCCYCPSSLSLWQLGSEDDTFWSKSRVQRLSGDLKKSYTIVPHSYVQCFCFCFFFFLLLLSTCSCISTWAWDVCVMHVLLLKDERRSSDLALLVWFRCWKELRLETVCLKALWKPACDKLPLSTVFSQV